MDSSKAMFLMHNTDSVMVVELAGEDCFRWYILEWPYLQIHAVRNLKRCLHSRHHVFRLLTDCANRSESDGSITLLLPPGSIRQHFR